MDSKHGNPIIAKSVNNHVKIKSDDKQIAYYLKIQNVEELVVVPKFYTTFHGDRHHAKNQIANFAQNQVIKKYGNVDKVSSSDNHVVVWCRDIVNNRKLIVVYDIQYYQHSPMYGSVFKTDSLERLELDDFCVIL